MDDASSPSSHNEKRERIETEKERESVMLTGFYERKEVFVVLWFVNLCCLLCCFAVMQSQIKEVC